MNSIVPPPVPAGLAIPTGVRQAILDWFDEHQISPSETWRRFKQREGLGDTQTVLLDLRQRFGSEAESAYRAAIGRVDPSRRGTPRVDRYARPSLLGIPATLFGVALEVAFELYSESLGDSFYFPEDWHSSYEAGLRHINRLFEHRGIHYRLDNEGRFTWYGDAGASAITVEPALQVLSDARLVECQREFQNAMTHLGRDTQADRSHAIAEAAKAVESAMKVVLAHREIELPRRQTAEPLWDQLRSFGLVPNASKEAILAVARIRNGYPIAHGAGAEESAIPAGMAAYAVGLAASTIVYLGQLLPD